MNMRLSRVLLACGLAVAVVPYASGQDAPQGAAAANPDQAAERGIRTTIGRYFQGHATGDPTHFRKAFLPTAHVETLREGKFTSWTLDEYCGFFKGSPAPDESTRVRKIDFVNATGNAAIAKVTLDYPKSVLTDYFLLLKVGDEWRIANKIATGRDKNTGKQ